MPKVRILAGLMLSALAPCGCFLLNGVSEYSLFVFNEYVWILLIIQTLILTYLYRLSNLKFRPDAYIPHHRSIAKLLIILIPVALVFEVNKFIN